VSTGIADTWSNHITPFLVVVKCKLEEELDASAAKIVSILFHFETSDAEALKINVLISCSYSKDAFNRTLSIESP